MSRILALLFIVKTAESNHQPIHSCALNGIGPVKKAPFCVY